MSTCQYEVEVRERGSPKRFRVCAAPAYYLHTFRRSKSQMFLCKAHGELVAGNFKDELKPLKT